jgi:triosephosphate isomerase
MRKQIVAGNWKMNHSLTKGVELCKSILALDKSPNKEVIIAAPYTHLSSLVNLTEFSDVKIAAQNCHQELSGAYTGEISASILANMSVEYVILGHSERRAYFGENNPLLSQKVNTALSQGLKVIYCCGETLKERNSNHHFDLVSQQISEALFHLDANTFSKVVIAYEPVWAIGTGETATSAQAQEMHAFLRSFIANKYGRSVADKVSILYGGSCNPANAEELFSQTDVDGGLIGGASLNANDFVSIINA